MDQKIPCPVCQNPIFFEPNALVRGEQFSCTKCQAVVGIASTSRKQVSDAMDTFDEIKSQVANAKIDS